MRKLKAGFMVPMWILCSVIAAALPGFSADSSVRFSVLFAGNAAGHQISTRSGDEITVHFEFNDRGRGPKIDSRIVLGEDGIPLSVETQGNDYLKARVEERSRSSKRCSKIAPASSPRATP